jgi:dTMP kinase
MNTLNETGLFVVVDGPNGVGKSSIVELIQHILECAGVKAITTREPTASPLGQWIRTNQGSVQGRTLACLVAANRYEHIESIIAPALASNTVVLTDRYVTSSFVYQIVDGVSPDFVWAVNEACLAPDITICLLAEPELIEKRMSSRVTRSRFEEAISPHDECALYRQACDYLRTRGWTVEVQDNTDGSAADIAQYIADRIIRLMADHNG